jgi:hypothetical protein
MDIDLVQVTTNLIVGAAGAWVAGKFGIRHGLEKAKGERALERRLTWYEKALRATMKFRNFNEEIALAIGKNDLTTLERMVSGNLQVTRSLQRTINESLVFADKSTYLRLKRVFKEFQRKMDEMNQDLAKQGPSDDIPQQYKSMARLMERASFDLAVSIRKQLGLDEITIQEFVE